MNVTCPDCTLTYDDTYRRTFCPHPTFEMHTRIVVKGVERCCHTVEELRAAMAENGGGLLT